MKIAGRYYRVRWLRLLYALAAGILLTALLFDVLAPVHGTFLRSALGLLMVTALLVLIFIAVRLVRFQTRAYHLLRRVLSGDYEAGMETSGFLHDEIAELEQLLNRFVQQVRQYDDLRSGRIRQLRMTLDSVLQHSREAIGLLDVEKDMLVFSPAAAGFLDTSKGSVKLDALKNQEGSRTLLELLTRTVEAAKCPQEGVAAVQIPGQDASREIYVRTIPYKDKQGEVSMVILFIEPVRGRDTGPAPRNDA